MKVVPRPPLAIGGRPDCAGRTRWLESACGGFTCSERDWTDWTLSSAACYKELHLIRRVRRLDVGGRFVEPSEVRRLCLEFLLLPRSSEPQMVNMAKCARAMLAMAVLANVVDVTSLGPNNETSTCSTAAVHERYPVRDALERRVLDLEQDRQHKAWWRAAYHRHSHLGSGWEFQHKGAKLLRLLANHTAMCGALGYTCAVYNPWEPRRCFSHHPLVKEGKESFARGHVLKVL